MVSFANRHEMEQRAAILDEVERKMPGGVPALAREFKITRSAIYQWSRVPAGRVLRISELTGIPCWRLRPDMYPRPETVAAGPASPAPGE